MDGLGGGLGGGDDLGFTRGERDRLLFLRAPGYSRLVEHEDVPGGRVLNSPVRVSVTVQRARAGLVPEADLASPLQVTQTALGLGVQDLGGSAHGATQHGHGVSNVGASVGSTELGVNVVGGLLGCVGDHLSDIKRVGHVAGGSGHRLVGQVSVGELVNVVGLSQRDTAVGERERTFVFDVPLGEGGNELAVQGSRLVRLVRAGQIVDVASDDEAVVAPLLLEQAGVGEAAFEALRLKPREQGSLPSATCLCHAVDRLYDLANERMAVAVVAFVALRGMTVDNFSFFKRALQVGRDEIPTVELEVVLRRQTRDEPE
eukprot:3649122-Prymnesium_polylepis.2